MALHRKFTVIIIVLNSFKRAAVNVALSRQPVA
jgi:hypothetical protein